MAKPVVLWGLWPDELSRALEHRYSIGYMHDSPRMDAIAPNFRLPDTLFEHSRRMSAPPRLLFVHSWSEIDSLLALDQVSIPMVAYFHDVSLEPDSLAWDLSHAFHWVLLDQRRDVRYFATRGAGNAMSWCPLYFKGTRQQALGCPPTQSRPIDVAFVGNLNPQIHPRRVEFLQSLEGRLGSGLTIRFGPGSYMEIYPKAKIVVDESHPIGRADGGKTAFGLKFRAFEAMACGAMLISDAPVEAMNEVFEGDVHYAHYEYGRADEAADLILRYLRADTERLAMAQAGWNHVATSHTSEARAGQIASVFDAALAAGPGLPRMPEADFCYYLGRAYLRLALRWRRRVACSTNPHYLERLDEAGRLLRKAEASLAHGREVAALIPAVRHVRGDAAGAIEGWSTLPPDSAVLAARFRAALELKQGRADGQKVQDTLRSLGSGGLNAEDDKIFAEIVYKTIIEDPL